MRRVLTVLLGCFAAIVALHPFEAYAGFTQSGSASNTVATGSLSAPTGLGCDTISLLSITLSWTAPSGVSTPSTLRYTVKRKQGTSVGTAYVAVQSGLATATYTGLAPGTGKYSYVVSASYNGWVSADSISEVANFKVSGSSCTVGV